MTIGISNESSKDIARIIDTAVASAFGLDKKQVLAHLNEARIKCLVKDLNSEAILESSSMGCVIGVTTK